MNVDFDKIINRRVRNEIRAVLGEHFRLFKPFDPGKVLLEYIETEVNGNHTKDVIYLRLLDGKKTSKYIKLVFPNEYPFIPPSVNVGGICYGILLRDLSYNTDGKFMVGDKKGVRCLCCETITCKDNWGPTYNIHTVVDEIKRSIELVSCMSLMVLISKIIDKNIRLYVPIDTYLLPKEYTGMNHRFWKKYFN